ncbi:MAG: 4Fe-4S dicluster domain-containing protein [Gammaproteobacteria bacterium]|nr:4Fe-4S dicluster domain-containing protein [Gammaproteobacteria bacterium]
MTRYAMAIDLNRCVGCQTCTAACKHTNATAPGVQWRKVLDFESGKFPDVHRTFVPVGCMHCSNPPCEEVCPTGATQVRADGVVSIDYERCIGCTYCVVACPYQARYKVDLPNRAYSYQNKMTHEVTAENERRRSVSQKCTFCADRIDYGLAHGLTPGHDPDATPACANACIADALIFGDLDDKQSRVSLLLQNHRYFRMHEEIGTGPNLYYLWDRKP